MIEVEFTLIVRDTIQDVVLDTRRATFPLMETITMETAHIPPEIIINTVRQQIDKMRQEVVNMNPVALAVLDDLMRRFETQIITNVT